MRTKRPQRVPRISVVICAYTEDRWAELQAAVASAQAQTQPPHEVIVVIDHNSALLGRARAAFAGCSVCPNAQQRGLSGARNTGVEAATGEVVAFLDDDAVAATDWLASLGAAYADPAVLGAGGFIAPNWEGGAPAWFPSEFLWVMGCSYTGLPGRAAPVRNVIGANMSCRRDVLNEVGGFRHGLGRVGVFPLGGEETELCIRSAGRFPGGVWLYQPAAAVRHLVPRSRATGRYFLTRCFAEGLTKARVARLVGPGAALASERRYATQTLPLGVLRALGAALRGDGGGLLRAAAIVGGLLTVGAGYAAGQVLKAPAAPVVPTAPPSSGAHRPEPRPLRVLEVELAGPLPTLQPRDPETGRVYPGARVLVRLHARPIGLVDLDLPPGGLGGEALAGELWAALSGEINGHLREDGLPEVTHLGAAGLPTFSTPRCLTERQALLERAPFMSVIVATRNRAARLDALLDLLLDLDYPRFEVVIVDNAPTDDGTERVVQARAARDARVRYVREDHPGLSNARNRGIRHARGEFVAITDDDVRPDRAWLTELARGFAAGENVGCVTGSILAMRLDTPAQAWIEQYGGFNKGFAPRLFDLRAHQLDSRMYPYAAGAFGSGANLAFRRSAWREVGGFDAALGAGTAGMGGEELSIFVELLQRGYQIAYRPGALLYHDHHADYGALQRQMFSYGAGLTAYLTAAVWKRPARLLDLAARVPEGLRHALHPASEKNSKKNDLYPAELTRLELRGMLYGPLAYLRSRRALAAVRRQFGRRAGGGP
ncbi:glycosyltransferase family 2 protein [Deinococcus hopiensis]|uniref:glycosyltransferase family 2 protein n=1 Tax=Deinococcus hopiensis TaxID=309885 RepID=UPI001BAF1099|nr:glycosyltransferase [Deinococcus hopiensis]